MARQLRVEYSGAIYHVTCRMLGDARSRLFLDDADRARFLERLGERVEQYDIRLYMFVLMTNHFHLVFETPEGNCSRFMQSLSTAYTVYYNLRHNRHGHLLDGRYKAKLVDGDDYLLVLSRYVHLNPVKVSPIRNRPMEERKSCLRQYPWSTYQSYIGEQKPFDYVDYGPVLSEMGGKKRARRKAYRKFVESGLAGDDKEFMAILKESPGSIGGEPFRAWVGELYQELLEKHARPEDVSFRRTHEVMLPDEVIEVLSEVLKVKEEEFCRRRRNSPLRAIAARYLMKYAGQSQREAADYLKAGSGSAVSKQMVRYKELLSGDRRWGKLMDKCETVLSVRRKQSHEK